MNPTPTNQLTGVGFALDEVDAALHSGPLADLSAEERAAYHARLERLLDMAQDFFEEKKAA